MKQLAFPTIAGAATYAGLFYVFDVRRSGAIAVGIIVGVAVLCFQITNQTES